MQTRTPAAAAATKPRPGVMRLDAIHELLLARYGEQDWWPAGSPFEVMVGAILTQNTAWRNVERAITHLIDNNALTPEAIIAASPEQLAAWLRPSGYFNIKARRLRNYCQWYLQQGGYAALDTLDSDTLRQALLSVNGVGYETADDILLYAFQRPVFVIDAYTCRLFTRLGLIEGHEKYEYIRHYCEAELAHRSDKEALFNEYHALIVRHAKRQCHKRPECEGCCLERGCPRHGV